MWKQVTNDPNMVRDTESGAILYTNSSLINKKKEANRLRKVQQKTVEELQGQVESLHDEMSEIKQLLIKLVEKVK